MGLKRSLHWLRFQQRDKFISVRPEVADFGSGQGRRELSCKIGVMGNPSKKHPGDHPKRQIRRLGGIFSNYFSV